MSARLADWRCDGCTTCDRCERAWCRDAEPSPLESDGICPDCALEEVPC